MTIKLRGDVVDNDTAAFYNWFSMDSISPAAVSDALEDAGGGDVDVSISSYGGDVFAASDIYTELKSYAGKVNVTVTGIAASAASVIAMAGDSVSMPPTAQLMIHNASSAVQGDTRVMNHEAGVLDNINKSIAAAYVAKTGMAKADLLDLMNQETWLTADQAKDYGFADKVLFDDDSADTLQAVASASSIPAKSAVAKFRNLLAAEKPANKAAAKPAATEPTRSNVLQQKLDILRGAK